MRKILFKIGTYFMQSNCNHESIKIIEIDYQERYQKSECKICGKIIYTDI
jgi:transcription elongation factor Elf1